MGVATRKQNVSKSSRAKVARVANATRATFEQLVFASLAELGRSNANGPKPTNEEKIVERFGKLATLAGKKLPKNYKLKVRRLLDKLKRRELCVPHQLASGPAHALTPLGRKIDLALRRRPQVKKAKDKTNQLEKYCNLQSTYTGPWKKVNNECAKISMLELVKTVQGLRKEQSSLKREDSWTGSYVSDASREELMEDFQYENFDQAEGEMTRPNTPVQMTGPSATVLQVSTDLSQDYPSPPPTSPLRFPVGLPPSSPPSGPPPSSPLRSSPLRSSPFSSPVRSQTHAYDEPGTPSPTPTTLQGSHKAFQLGSNRVSLSPATPNPSRRYDLAVPLNTLLRGSPEPLSQHTNVSAKVSSWNGLEAKQIAGLQTYNDQVSKLNVKLEQIMREGESVRQVFDEEQRVIQRGKKIIRKLERELEELEDDRSRNSVSQEALREHLKHSRATRESQRRQDHLKSEERSLIGDIQRITETLANVESDMQQRRRQIEDREIRLLELEETVEEITVKLQSIYDGANKSLRKQKARRDMNKWRLEVERKSVEALNRKDQTAAGTLKALTTSQRRTAELEALLEKQDKWVIALEDWITSAFPWTNEAVDIHD